MAKLCDVLSRCDVVFKVRFFAYYYKNLTAGGVILAMYVRSFVISDWPNLMHFTQNSMSLFHYVQPKMCIETCRAETGMGFLRKRQPETFYEFTVQCTNVVSFFKFLAFGQWWGHKHFMGDSSLSSGP